MNNSDFLNTKIIYPKNKYVEILDLTNAEFALSDLSSNKSFSNNENFYKFITYFCKKCSKNDITQKITECPVVFSNHTIYWIWFAFSQYNRIEFDGKLNINSANAAFTFINAYKANRNERNNLSRDIIETKDDIFVKIQLPSLDQQNQADDMTVDNINSQLIKLVIENDNTYSYALKNNFMNYIDSSLIYIRKDMKYVDYDDIFVDYEYKTKLNTQEFRNNNILVKSSYIKSIPLQKNLSNLYERFNALLDTRLTFGDSEHLYFKEIKKIEELFSSIKYMGLKYGFSHNDAHSYNILYDISQGGNYVLIDYGRVFFDSRLLYKNNPTLYEEWNKKIFIEFYKNIENLDNNAINALCTHFGDNVKIDKNNYIGLQYETALQFFSNIYKTSRQKHIKKLPTELIGKYYFIFDIMTISLNICKILQQPHLSDEQLDKIFDAADLDIVNKVSSSQNINKKDIYSGYLNKYNDSILFSYNTENGVKDLLILFRHHDEMYADFIKNKNKYLNITDKCIFVGLFIASFLMDYYYKLYGEQLMVIEQNNDRNEKVTFYATSVNALKNNGLLYSSFQLIGLPDNILGGLTFNNHLKQNLQKLNDILELIPNIQEKLNNELSNKIGGCSNCGKKLKNKECGCEKNTIRMKVTKKKINSVMKHYKQYGGDTDEINSYEPNTEEFNKYDIQSLNNIKFEIKNNNNENSINNVKFKVNNTKIINNSTNNSNISNVKPINLKINQIVKPGIFKALLKTKLSNKSNSS